MADFTPSERAAVYRAIFERRDVRNYRPDLIPADVLMRILDAAHHAPSVGFMQPWNFVVLRSIEVRQRVYEHFAEVNGRAAEVFHEDRKTAYQALKLQGILDAPVNVLVTCDHERAGEHVLGRFTMRETDVYSTCLAVQNLWLAARAEGIGVGWMSIMEPAAIARLLALPPSVTPVAYLTLGYPVEFAEKPMLSQVGWRDRVPLGQLVFEDRWGQHLPTVESSPSSPDAEPKRHAVASAPVIPEAARRRMDSLTKPQKSLGRLESLALQLCALQDTVHPVTGRVALTVFAADHGVTEERVSAFKADTTLKLVYAYLAGGGVVNALARQQEVEVHVVDVGVDHDFGEARGLTSHTIRRGTRNLAREAAMTPEECSRAVAVGRDVVRGLPDLRVLALGEVGIGNSTSAAALTAALLSASPDAVTGRGTGLDDAGRTRKQAVIARSLALHAGEPRSPDELLQRLGGYEIAALVGAIEAAVERRALVVLDGMITAVAALVALRRDPNIVPYLVASHRGPEPAHGLLLEALGLRPLLELEMCLGEGSGAVLAVGLVRAACAVMREVRTYEEANIERPERLDT